MPVEAWIAIVVVALVALGGGGDSRRYKEIEGRGKGWTTSREAQRQHLTHFGRGRRKRR